MPENTTPDHPDPATPHPRPAENATESATGSAPTSGAPKRDSAADADSRRAPERPASTADGAATDDRAVTDSGMGSTTVDGATSATDSGATSATDDRAVTDSGMGSTTVGGATSATDGRAVADSGVGSTAAGTAGAAAGSGAADVTVEAASPTTSDTPAKPASPAGPPDATARRLGQSLRDMVWSLVALFLIIGAVLVFNRGCSFSPGGPTVDPSSAPTVELAQVLPGSAKTVDFPLRLPEVPDGWVANSSSTGAVPPTSVVVRSGWLTPGRFVQLSQSGAAGADLVRAETGQDDPTARADVDVSGTKWTVYPGRRTEAAWLADLGDVRLLITGTGTEAEFRALAEATQQAAPLPKE